MQTQIRSSVPARTSRRRWATVLVAPAGAVAAWTVAHPLLGIDLLVDGGTGPTRQVGQLAVCLAALFAGLTGWALLAVLERLTPRAHTVWRVLASVAFLVSLTGPLAAVTTGATVALVVLHTIVGATLIAGLPGAAGRTQPRTAVS